MRRIGSRVVRWLVVAGMCALPVQGFGAAKTNSVISTSIKPADGTTGQNVTTGSGVKTGHIQDGAVTSAKIEASAVTTTAIANGAVTNVKLGTAAVATTNIADGAVTNTKISGTISVDKLATYNGVVVVHTGPANGITTFNSISAALATQPTLIKIMPGIYNEDITEPAIDKDFQIEGSGSENTIINGNIGLMWNYSHKFVIKNVTINGQVNISTPNSENTISDVVVNNNIGSTGISISSSYNKVGHTTINNVKIVGAVSGMRISDTTVNINNSSITGPITGIEVDFRSTLISTNSYVSGGSYAINILANGYTDLRDVNLINSQLIGTPIAGAWAPVKILNCYDGVFNIIPNQ